MKKICPEPEENPASVYPGKLQAIVSLFEMLPEEEKRENLIAYADQARNCGPRDGEKFDLEDVRKDEECADTVGVHLRVDAGGEAHLRLSLGPKVQILTKAMATILCKGLEGCALQEILDVPADFVPKIVGGQLVRVRSQTVYYILTRIKGACRAFLNRKRMAEAEG